MKKPMIAMSARDFYIESYKITMLANIDSYSDYIRMAGGIPSTFLAHDEAEAADAAAAFDGLLITGGGDIDPALYGEENRASDIVSKQVDQSDIYLYRAFVRAGKPVLAICRGIQVIAAAEGVSLIQDIPSEGKYCAHNQREANPPVPNNAFFHDCTFVKNTKLWEVFGDAYPVNSFHHQACTAVPANMKEAARSTDGIIEAFENDLVTAVQWHPERLSHDPKHLEIAKQFIRACSADKA